MQYDDFVRAWFTIGILAASVLFLLASLAWALGTGFVLPKLKEWGRQELYEAILTIVAIALMFVFIIPVFNGALNAVAGPCPSVLTCPFCDNSADSLAIEHVSCFLDQRKVDLTAIFGTLLLISMQLGLLQTTGVVFEPFQFGVDFSVLPGIAPLSQLVGLLITGVGAGLSFLQLQSILFGLIKTKVLFLLPLGLGLRALPFTRGAGAALTALFFGLYFLYPVMFLLESRMVNYDLGAFPLTTLSSSGILFPNPLNAAVPSSLGIVNLILDPLKRIGVEVTYITFIVGIFLPVFNLSITFIFTRELSKALGGELDISALTRMI